MKKIRIKAVHTENMTVREQLPEAAEKKVIK